MTKNILISGFGGQGMMKLGKILAQAALYENKHTSWFPSYGAEMRGGTAHCFVKISTGPISSPFIKLPDIAVIFNKPSLQKFKTSFTDNTKVILNMDLIGELESIKAKRIIKCPLNKIALSCGNIKVANIVALGMILSLDEILKKKTMLLVLREIFPKKNSLKQNLEAFSKGETYVTS
ncbi:MAG: 2-oxoacid:acceptor oxidoreductase family protein [Candidatus Omnitrophica bacterium]|nr:2-oxoacid:acceptor oxidoreductase family protein [Candidatus Omnitrophota bacterium]